jgi:hypothetical protein
MVELQKAVASQGNVIGSTLQTVTKCSASGRWVEKETKIETQSADWISSHVLSHFFVHGHPFSRAVHDLFLNVAILKPSGRTAFSVLSHRLMPLRGCTAGQVKHGAGSSWCCAAEISATTLHEALSNGHRVSKVGNCRCLTSR